MGKSFDVIKNSTILDLSLPGTHDTLTYDLSETFSYRANSMPEWLSDILHIFGDIPWVNEFVKRQATT